MEHWQFLIQKQGDRSWHALESPNTEIFEGRYRVLARSSLRNIDVEVRVTHVSTQDVPPKRRIQKQLRRTNSEGLVAVIPFTYLKAGAWELRCSGDLISDILGKSWQYAVHLQVNSQLADESQEKLNRENNVESDFIDQSDAISDSIPEPKINHQNNIVSAGFSLDPEDAAIDAPISPVWLKGETAEQILQNLIDLALPNSESLLEEPEQVEDSPKHEPILPLLLTLDRQTYITRWGHLLTIHGSVEQADNTLNLASLYALELRIELRSPLRSEILTQIRQPLADKSLPFTIHSAIDISLECESKLILADIRLYGAIANPGSVTLLASYSFTITADVDDLLAVTNRNEQKDTIPPTSTPEPITSLDLELFNIAKTPSTRQSQPIYPSPSFPLPEQIDPQSLKKAADFRVPQLPKLPENPAEVTITPDVVLEPTLEVSLTEAEEANVPPTPAPINLDQLVIKQRRSRNLGSTFPYLKPIQALRSVSETEISQEVEELSQVDVSIPEDEPELEFVSDNTEIPDEFVAESELQSKIETIAGSTTEEIIDVSPTELQVEPPSELANDSVEKVSIAPPITYSSPLIRKWMETQGYSLPEFLTDTDTVPQQQISPEEPPTVFSSSEPLDEVNLSLEVEPETAPLETDAVTSEEENLIFQESLELEPELLSVEVIQTPSTWLAQEIVVDDSEHEPELDISKSQLPKIEQQAIANPTNSPPRKILEPLPIPQLYVPDGELIAGKLVRVRIELPKVSSQVVVKLWVEDCQTRWLLDGPHLLTDLLPNSSGNLEVMTQLNIPFGCLEIRIEAIALNTATQQESHKVTILKTVIPPDLPNVSLNDLLDI